MEDGAERLSRLAGEALDGLFKPSSAEGERFLERLVNVICGGRQDGVGMRMVESGCLLLAGSVASVEHKAGLVRQRELLAGLMGWAERGSGKVSSLSRVE